MTLVILIVAGIASIGLYALTSRLVERFVLARALNLTLLRVRLPRVFAEKDVEERERKSGKDLIGIMEQFLTSVSVLRGKGLASVLIGRPYVVFEIAVANVGEEITFYAALPRKLIGSFEKTLHSLYPEAEVTPMNDYNIFHPNGAAAGAIVRLANHWALPVNTYRTLQVDPLENITNAMSKLEEMGEGAALQVIVRAASHKKRTFGLRVARQMQKTGHDFNRACRAVGINPQAIAHEAWRVLTGAQEKQARELQMQRQAQMAAPSAAPWTGQMQPITPLHQEIIKAIENKSAKPFFEANIRLIASASTGLEAEEILAHMEGAFAQFTAPQLNSFRVIRKKGRALQDLLFRYSFRIFRPEECVLLSAEEVASVFHFPNVPLETPKVEFLKAKPAAPPLDLAHEGIIIGKNIYRGKETLVRMAPEDRRRHLYIIGQTGTGKTTLLQELIRQDMMAGQGVGVIDPHGDLADAVLALVPRERAEDVVYFNPADSDRPMGLNMLEWKTPEQRDFAVQEMIRIFEKLFPPEVIGPMFEHNMRNAMLTLMSDSEDPGTVAEIPRIFTDDAFARRKLEKVQDPMVRAFWEKEMAKTTEFHKSEMLGYLISKVGRFVENEAMRNIIGQAHSGFDVREIMDGGKIFIANLSKGRLGEVNAALLGLVLVAKMQMAAMARASTSEEARRDFFLYIDEFQNFTTDSISTILSEARKYHLNLIIAHQFISQLADSIREAVFGNVGSLLAFRVGAKDAEFLVKQFAPVFTERDLLNIDNFSNYVKLMVHGKNTLPFNTELFPPNQGNATRAAALKELSRLRFGRPKMLVEEEIFERSRLAVSEKQPPEFVPGERNR